MDIKLFDDDLWIYTSEVFSTGSEKDSDGIFHRVNLGYLHIQWWDFPDKDNEVIKSMTQTFNQMFNNPTIHQI